MTDDVRASFGLTVMRKICPDLRHHGSCRMEFFGWTGNATGMRSVSIPAVQRSSRIQVSRTVGPGAIRFSLGWNTTREKIEAVPGLLRSHAFWN